MKLVAKKKKLKRFPRNNRASMDHKAQLVFAAFRVALDAQGEFNTALARRIDRLVDVAEGNKGKLRGKGRRHFNTGLEQRADKAAKALNQFVDTMEGMVINDR